MMEGERARKLVVFLFFQAEDGIRDLVRSRGLGDVYKRQLPTSGVVGPIHDADQLERAFTRCFEPTSPVWVESVSYTHLTLPTSDLV